MATATVDLIRSPVHLEREVIVHHILKLRLIDFGTALCDTLEAMRVRASRLEPIALVLRGVLGVFLGTRRALEKAANTDLFPTRNNISTLRTIALVACRSQAFRGYPD